MTTPMDKTASRVSEFWSKIDWMSTPEPNSGCWIWLGAVATCRNDMLGGYARMRHGGKVRNASNAVIEMVTGCPIPHGMEVLHRCDNPLCVNPDHLRLGSRSENLKEMYRRGRHKRVRLLGESSPSSKLTEKQVREVRFGRLAGFDATHAAKALGVSRSSISAIRLGKTWRHIQ